MTQGLRLDSVGRMSVEVWKVHGHGLNNDPTLIICCTHFSFIRCPYPVGSSSWDFYRIWRALDQGPVAVQRKQRDFSGGVPK